MITLYAQLAGIVLALACVNALARRAYRRRKPKGFDIPDFMQDTTEIEKRLLPLLLKLGEAKPKSWVSDEWVRGLDWPAMNGTCGRCGTWRPVWDFGKDAEVLCKPCWLNRPSPAETTCVADLGSARAIEANGGER